MSFASISNGSSINEIAPVGSIIAYLGTADIDGWIICDGVARSNVNGKYSRLSGIVGTFSGAVTGAAGATYTPPNLQSKFLYGTSDKSSVGGGGGAASQSITLTVSNMPSHNHGISDPGHKHNWNTGLEVDDDGTGGSYNEYTRVPGTVTDAIATAYTGISVDYNGSGTAFTVNTVPPYIAVNYIIKF